MKRKLYLILCPLFLIISIYSEDIREYKQIELHKIKHGAENCDIGFDPRRSQMAAPTGPTAFTIGYNGLIYVCDTINNRINIYDQYFHCLKQFKNNLYYEVYDAPLIKIDNKGNLFAMDIEQTMIKIDFDGNLLFKIDSNKLPQDVKNQYNFFSFDDYVLYYDSKSTNKIIFLNAEGKEIDNLKFDVILNNIKKISAMRSLFFNTSDQVKSVIDKFQNEKKVIIDKSPLTTDFNIHRELYNNLQGSQFNSLSKRYTSQNEIKDRVEFDLSNIGKSKRFIGFDSEQNSYWKCDVKNDLLLKVILSLSPYGEILDAFYNNIPWSLVAIAPNGDVYFLSYDADWTYFHKVERVW